MQASIYETFVSARVPLSRFVFRICCNLISPISDCVIAVFYPVFNLNGFINKDKISSFEESLCHRNKCSKCFHQVVAYAVLLSELYYYSLLVANRANKIKAITNSPFRKRTRKRANSVLVRRLVFSFAITTWLVEKQFSQRPMYLNNTKSSGRNRRKM